MASPSAGSAAVSTNTQQYGRVCTLLVSNAQGDTLDLSALRIKFKVKKSGIMTPNAADIIVYNIDKNSRTSSSMRDTLETTGSSSRAT